MEVNSQSTEKKKGVKLRRGLSSEFVKGSRVAGPINRFDVATLGLGWGSERVSRRGKKKNPGGRSSRTRKVN